MAHLVVYDTTEPHGQLATVDRAPSVDGRSADPQREAAMACAVLELIACAGDAATAEHAAAAVVNLLKSYLAADGVAIGMTAGAGRCRLAAISGVAQIDRGSEMCRAIESALADAVYSENAVTASDGPRVDRLLPGAVVVCRGLNTASRQTVGAVLAWGGDAPFDRPRCERFLRFASEPLAGALRLQRQSRAGLLDRALRGAAGTRRWLLWALPLVIGLAATFLLPYRIACDCAAEPLTRRFVSAPFAGVFEKSLVRPGDFVVQDSLLGQMDGRELRIELAAITADYEQARKSYDMNLAGGKVAAAQIDRLELARLDQQRSLIEYRMANLQIKSPVSGYVIGGDLKRTEGAPLTVGQVLYEIAPLDQMIVEVAIPDDEVAQVQIGQAASIRFDAYANQVFDGRLVRIHPRSETRDSRNVFIGEVALDGAEVTLRPGMRGRARLVIVEKNLAWGLSERARHAVAMYFGL